MDSNQVIPLKRDVFLPIARKIIGHIDSLGTYDWPHMADSTLIAVLDSMYRNEQIKNPPVYVSGAKVYFLNNKGELHSTEHQVALPYKWPIAHEVRSAAQSLGVNGCQDCHNPASNFAFGDIRVDTPLESVSDIITMNVFLDQNIVYENVFASTFYMRPFYKYVLAAAVMILLAIMFIYALKGLRSVLHFLSADDITRGGKK